MITQFFIIFNQINSKNNKDKLIALAIFLTLSLPVSAADDNLRIESKQTAEALNDHCTKDPLLVEVLTSEDAKALQLIYSDRLIDSRMRAIGKPSGSFTEQLSTWLSLYHLEIVTNSGNNLITRSTTTPYIAGKVLNENGNELANADINIAGIKETIKASASGCFYVLGNHPIETSEQQIKINDNETDVVINTENNWWRIRVNAKPQPELENVIVIGSSHQVMHNKLSQKTFFEREQIERMPHIGDDIARVFRQLPGASSGDFSAKINMRGGEQNELAMVIDGLELHKPWYFKGMDGLGSIVDSNLIASADVLSGGYTAEYSDKSSAIIDIKTLETDEVQSRVGISFLTAFTQTGGQFENNSGGWYGSLRGGYLDLVFELAGSDADIEPRYTDVFAKTDIELNDNHRLSVNLLVATDKFFWDDDEPNKRLYANEDSWNNNFWINLQSDINEFIEAKSSLSFIDFDHGMQAYYEDPKVVWQDNRKYQALGFKSDWTATLTPNHLLKWGVALKDLTAEYDYFLAVHVAPYHENPLHMVSNFQEAHLKPEGQERSTYLAWRYKISDKWVTELGGRRSEHTYTQLDEDTLFSPRFNAVYDMSDKSQINFSWGKFYQAQAIDDLYPGAGDITFHPSQLAEHRNIGLHHSLNPKVELRMDIYQKKYSNLIPRYENLYPNIEKVVNEASDDWIRIAPESALAEGVELGVTYNSQKHFSTWANYTYSKVNDSINDKEIPRSWDQENVFNFGFEWNYTEWHFNLSGMIRSGWPTTPSVVDPRQPRNNNAVKPDYENYNSERQDGYSRLDIRISRKHQLSNGNLLQYYFEVYNLLNSENPCCTKYEAEFSGNDSEGKTVPQFENWLPFLPSFGVQYIF